MEDIRMKISRTNMSQINQIADINKNSAISLHRTLQFSE